MSATPSLDQLLLEIIEIENVYSNVTSSREFSPSGLISKSFVFSFIKKLLLLKFPDSTIREIDTFVYNRTRNQVDQRRLFEFFTYPEELHPSHIFSLTSAEYETGSLLSNLVKIRNFIRKQLILLNGK